MTTLTIELPTSSARQLRQEAAKRNSSAEDLAGQLLVEQLRVGLRSTDAAKSTTPAKRRSVKRKRPTLRELNAKLDATHAERLELAKKNCIELTGRPTL